MKTDLGKLLEELLLEERRLIDAVELDALEQLVRRVKVVLELYLERSPPGGELLKLRHLADTNVARLQKLQQHLKEQLS